MTRNYAVLFVVFPVIFLFCGKDSPTGLPVVAGETWHLVYPGGVQRNAEICLSKHTDSSVSVYGTLNYNFYGYLITGTMSGTATIIDSSVTISASGVASYPPDSSGVVESSGFNLQMSGSFIDSAAQGTWEIHFDNPDWEGWIDPGTFTGRLQNGIGVTALSSP
jgi:hypothetical protein